MASTFGARTAAGQEPCAAPAAIDGTERATPGEGPADTSCTGSCARGRALGRAGRSGEAESELRRGLARAAGAPNALAVLHLELAHVYADRGDVARSLAACEHVIALAGHAAEGHACRANAHLVWRRASEALSETALALAIDPRSYAAKVAAGRAYDLELDAPRAETALRDALSIQPDGVDAHLALAHVFSIVDRREDAVAEWRRAIALDPTHPQALFELAVVLPPGAERGALLDRATRARPSFTAAWVALSKERLAERCIGAAKDALAVAARADPSAPEVMLLSGQIALGEGRADDALRAGEAVLKLLANSPAAALLVADAHAKKGEIDAALGAYQAAWSLNHADPTPLVHASEACHAAGRNTSARAYALRATQEFPRWAPAWAALGNALSGEAEGKSAREAYARALAAPEGPLDREAVRREAEAAR